MEIAIDAGPAMTAMLWKSNGEVIYWSTYHGLADVEVVNQAHIKSQEEFDEAIGNKFGVDCTPVGGYPSLQQVQRCE